MNTDMKDIVRMVMEEIIAAGQNTAATKPCDNSLDDFSAPDIGEFDQQNTVMVDSPNDSDAILEMKKRTPARIGLGRSGTRPKTKALLKFRADHAASMDAVFSDVDEELIKRLGLLQLQSTVLTKEEFLMQPARGRLLNDESVELVKQHCARDIDVQIIVADGLSSTAVEANIEDMLPAIEQGVKGKGMTLGTPVFVKYGRVGVMDHIAGLVNSKVTVNLIGERPGLVTGESYSAYMTYGGKIGMPESGRTVVSNIYRGGTPPVEAAAHIADLCKRLLEARTSGMDLK